jgi:NAD-dependent deacetylase
VRPGVVWFGEALPEEVLLAAESAASGCDFFLAVGTSALVYPAASLIHRAPPTATRVVVNISPTDDVRVARYLLLAPAGSALPALVNAAFGLP